MSVRNLFRGLGFGRKVSAAGALLAMYQVAKAAWSGRETTQLAEEGYRKNVVAFRCIKLLASGMAAVPWVLKQGKGKAEKELDTHPVLDLLAAPNPWQSGAVFFEGLFAYYLIAGNTYLEMVPAGIDNAGKPPSAALPPVQLFALRPDRMKVIVSNVGTPGAYAYVVNGQTREWKADPFTGESAILHHKAFNPLNDFLGMSPLEHAAYAIDQHNAASAWNMALLQNSARPSGALVYNPKGAEGAVLTEDQYQRLRLQVDEMFSGQRNAGRPLVLDGGLDWKAMGLSPADMDWINGKHVSAREICLAFGVPPYLLGIPGDATYNNYAEARQGLYEDTLLPLLDSFVDALNARLLPYFDPSRQLRLGIDVDEIPALAPKRAARWQAVTAATWLTPNEKREATGYSALPIEEADRVYQGAALVALEDTGLGEVEAGEAEGEDASKKPAVGSGIDESLVGVQDTALNGTQISSLVDIAARVANGQLPLETAILLVTVSFPGIEQETARAMLAPADGFTPEELGGGDDAGDDAEDEDDDGEKKPSAAAVAKRALIERRAIAALVGLNAKAKP